MGHWRTWHKPPEGALVEGPAPAGATSEFEWIDVTDPSAEDLRELAERYRFDEVALESAADTDLYPRQDDFETHLVLALRALVAVDDDVDTTPLLCFVTPEVLVTVHHHGLPSVDFVAEEAMDRPRSCQGGTDRMVARLADAVVRRYEPLIDEIERLLETLETEALDAQPGVVQGLHPLRRYLADLRSVIRPQRLVLQSVVRAPSAVLGERAVRRLSDVVDRHVRLAEDIEAARLMATAVVDLHRGAVAERTNDAMRVLTVFSATLLPMTVVAGIYGMNLEDLPFTNLGGEGATGVLVLMGVIAALMWAYFASRGFVSRSRVGAAAVRSTSTLVSAATLPLRGIGVVAGSVIPDAVLRPWLRGGRAPGLDAGDGPDASGGDDDPGVGHA